MVNGGVEKELLTILNKFNYSEFDITVCVFYVDDFEQAMKLPPNVHFISLNIVKDYWTGNLMSLVKKRLKKFRFGDAFSLFFKTLINSGSSSAFLNIQTMPNIEDTYDYAVCYHMHSGLVARYVAEKIKAKKKYIWIHNDFENSGFKVKKYEKAINEYSKIIAVSNALANEFSDLLPKTKQKVMAIHNYIDIDNILSLSTIKTNDSFFLDTRYRILTVGRFVEQKGYNLALETARILKEKQFIFSWYFIGWGPMEEEIKNDIKRKNLQDCVHILGKKSNPYPYMKECNLYVQTSIHEGYPLTILEAKSLGAYVVSTGFNSANEAIEDIYEGVICKTCLPIDISYAIMSIKKIDNKNNNHFCKINLANLNKILGLFT